MYKKLEKNEFLIGLETLLQKYGYTRVYAESEFDGTKLPGLYLKIEAEDNPVAEKELTDYVDYTLGLKDYTMAEAGLVIIKPVIHSKEYGIVYDKGEFYATS